MGPIQINYSQIEPGDVVKFIGSDKNQYIETVNDLGYLEGFGATVKPTDYTFWINRELLEVIKNKQKNTMSKVIDTIKLARMSEPDKTLIKAGLMNLDGSLTISGKEAMDDLLIQEHKEKLKTNYALPILAEEKK